MLFCVLNTRAFPCPRTHMLHVRKLAEGFIQRGFHYRELNDINEIRHLTGADLLYVSNHFSTEIFHRRIKASLQRVLMRQLKSTKARLILWSFHTTPDWNSLGELPHQIVHLGEDLYESAIDQEPVLRAFRDRFNVLTLRYASPLHPIHSSRFEISRDHDFNFIGHGYQKTMTSHCEKKYHSLIRNTPPNVSEPLRFNSFRQSEVNLVFHAPSNIRKGVIVERFAEALSLGGIIFHDHPRISDEFPGLASLFLVTAPADIDRAHAQVMQLSAGARTELRDASWTAWQGSGLSYFDQAGRILSATLFLT